MKKNSRMTDKQARELLEKIDAPNLFRPKSTDQNELLSEILKDKTDRNILVNLEQLFNLHCSALFTYYVGETNKDGLRCVGFIFSKEVYIKSFGRNMHGR